MSAQLDRVRQRPSHCLAKTLLAHALAPLFLSRFCGLRGSCCTLVILDRAPALAQGTERLGSTLSRAMTLYSPRPPSVCADFLQWSAVLEGPLAPRSSLTRPVSWAPPARMLAGGRGSIPRDGAAAGRRFTGSRRRRAPRVIAKDPRVGEQPPPPCVTSIAPYACPRTSPASPHSPLAFQRSSPSPSCFWQSRGLKTDRLLGS